ncbi:MAG TPA: phosphoglucosamine mutase, partial [Firmicutes bacterium]|nr:phosphoglucosamine mutase [Bacillota bacterium]
ELQGQGRVLVRPSGTEPLIRVMLEGPQKAQLQALAQAIAEVIKTEQG